MSWSRERRATKKQGPAGKEPAEKNPELDFEIFILFGWRVPKWLPGAFFLVDFS